MFSSRYKEKVMEVPLRSPADFCASLGLRPVPCQADFMERFAGVPEAIEAKADQDGAMVRVMALCALWRVISLPGCIGTVIAAKEEDGKHFMAFLGAVIEKTTPGLAAITSMKRWNVLSVGSSAGWGLRYIPNNVTMVTERAKNSNLAIILGAGSSNTQFSAAREALESSMLNKNKTLLRLW